MAIEQHPPEVLALVIADHLHPDDDTAEFFIRGTCAIVLRDLEALFGVTCMRPIEKTKVTVVVTRPVSLELLRKYASTKPLRLPTPRAKG